MNKEEKMKPIKFKGVNFTYAKDQPPYIQLPVHKTSGGEVISCWALTRKERWRVLLTGKLWWSVLTFNYPLQPQRPLVKRPNMETVSQVNSRPADRPIRTQGGRPVG